MKTFCYTICALLLIVVYASALEGKCLYNGEVLQPGIHDRDCNQITCNDDGTTVEKACPLIKILCVRGTHLAYRRKDNSQPYPECCARPICEED